MKSLRDYRLLEIRLINLNSPVRTIPRFASNIPTGFTILCDYFFTSIKSLEGFVMLRILVIGSIFLFARRQFVNVGVAVAAGSEAYYQGTGCHRVNYLKLHRNSIGALRKQAVLFRG